MSAYKYFEPILSYSLNQNFVFDIDNYFIEIYNLTIDSLISNNIQEEKYLQNWDFLKSETFERKLDIDGYLLTTLWGQSSNSAIDIALLCGNYLDPSYGAYNKFVQGNSNCGCGHCTAGCTPLAMAQIIKYWQHPTYSNKRTYNFDLMPNELVDTSTFEQIDEIAHLIADCGDLSGATYCIPFSDCQSGATINQIKRSLTNDFKFSEEIEKLKLTDYSYNDWFDIIRNQIDNKMPVIIYGKGDDAFDRHGFICDGYSSTENNYFHINTGNKGEKWYYFPEDGYYTNDVKMLINIYPKVMYGCSEVVDLGEWYSENEDYLPLIDQPWAGTVLTPSNDYPASFRTVNSGDVVNMHAYNSIVLRSGFSVKQGGKFHAYLTDCSQQKNTINKSQINNTDSLIVVSTVKLTIFPNPVKTTAQISYFLPAETDFEIIIYDIFGNIIKNVTQGYKNSGNLQTYINLSDLQNGVYFCVLKSNQGTISKKIIKI